MTVLPPATVMAGLGYESAAKALGADRASAAPATLTDTAPAAGGRAPDRRAIACQRDLMMFTGSPCSWCRRPCAGQPLPLRRGPAEFWPYPKGDLIRGEPWQLREIQRIY